MPTPVLSGAHAANAASAQLPLSPSRPGDSARPALPSLTIHPLSGPSCTVTVSGENLANNAVQTAIDAALPGSTICVGAGTYPEQLTITTPGLTLYGAGNSSTIIAPTSLTFNTVDWDSAHGSSSSVPCGPDICVPLAAIVLVANSTGGPTTGVSVENLQVNGAPGSSSVTCGDDYVGVDFQDSSGTLSAASVVNVASPLSSFGCQEVSGAVYAYNGYFFTGIVPSPAVAVTVTNSTVTGYQKNGITCGDLGESCTIIGNTVTGIGATTLTAQNGIQIGFGASAVVTANHVTGDHYTGGIADNADYFAPVYTASGILVYDAGNVATIRSNVLSGDDLGIAVFGTASANVSGNEISQGFSYGITFDLNASASYLGLPVYSTDSPWTSTAFGNSVQNVNVGILVYDDNLTLSGSASNVNVSVESMTDHVGSNYALTIRSFQSTSNVSGFLLGNLSSYQSTSGFYARPVGMYTLTGDNVTSTGAPPPTGSLSGIAINGSSASILNCRVAGFATDIYLDPTMVSGIVQHSSVIVSASLGEPGIGIWAGNQAPNPVTDATASFQILGNSITGPGGATDSPLAGGAGIIAGGSSVRITDNLVTDFSAVYGSIPTNTEGPGSGYDWWEGTQSVGILVGCAPSTPATACLVTNNTLTHNTIGVTVILTNSVFGGTWQTGPVTIEFNVITNSGGYGVYTSMGGQGAGPSQTSIISGNVIDNTVTGAPALDLAGQAYNVSDNLFIGTSATGTQGPVQGEGGPSITTATVQATDYWDYGYAWTTVTLFGNEFLNTTLYWSTSWTAGSLSSLSGGELVTFSETGLPGGTIWGVSNPRWAAVATSPSSFVVDLPNGSAAFSVHPVTGYTPSPSSGSLTIAGAPASQLIVFSPANFTVTFTETGLPHGTTWWLNLTNGQRFSSGSTMIVFSEPNGNYSYLFGISYSHPRDYSAPSGTFTVSGHSVASTVGFVPVRPVRVTEHGLPSGMEWWVNLTVLHSSYMSGSSFHATTPSITFYLGNGQYTMTFAAQNSDYAAHAHGFSIAPIGTTSPRQFSAAFHLVVFSVRITETGLPHGAGWCVVLSGSRSYCSHGAVVSFKEPNGTYAYALTTTARGFTGAGGSFTVSGATLSRTVTFSA